MKNRPLFCLIVLMSLAAHASGALLLDRGHANWRWRPGTNEASAPVTAWRTAGFNDSQFTTATAPFWFGDILPGGTEVTGMLNVYTSLFLRVTFDITNVSEVAFLKLGALVDDGFVAWINGVEVQRVNMPGVSGDPVSITNLANNAVEPVPFVLYNLPAPPSYLVVGSNVLSVQVFQSSATSSDFGFDASLESVLVETNPPVVASATPSGGGTVSALSSVTVTFNEPVTGVDAADLLIGGTPASSVTPVSSTVYSFGFPQPAYGTVQITWAAGHGIADQAVPPNPFNATGPTATWQYTLVDQAAPILVTISPAGGATVRWLTNITVVFSESVTGVDAADLRVNATSAANFSGGANIYTFSFPQPVTGLVQVAWVAGHGITDLAGVPNAFAGGNWLYTLDPNASQDTGPIISEFMAANITTAGALLDEYGESSDWIEVQNVSSTAVNLQDWSLTDDVGDLTKWRFPATNVAAGGFLVVFASDRNQRVPGRPLHTGFKLESSGEYLALVRPNGSIASEFAPTFQPQVAGVSFGQGTLSTNSTLVSTSALARVRIPANGTDGTNWLYAGFNDSGWTAGTNGVGYGTTNVTAADYSASVLPTGPLVYYRMSETAGATAANLGSMGISGNGSYVNTPTLNAAGPRPPQFNGFEPVNRAVQLIGTAATDYVAGPPGLLTSRTAFTIAGWIRPTAAQPGRAGLFGQNDAVEFGFISPGVIQAWTPSGSIASFAYPFPDNEWHHVALVGAGGQFTLYLDGTSRISAAAAAGGAAGNFNIGGGGIFDATGNDFVGQMDEVGMWDRALSGTELLGLFNAGAIAAGVSVVPFVKTDVTAGMSNINASAYIRLPFNIDDPSNVQLLTLKMRHDDGFVAFVNGVEVARANAPATLLFNSAATNTHTVATVDQFTLGPAVLRPGANVLAIHGLNSAANDEDFLIGAELTAVHAAAASSGGVYMTGPTPGLANGAGVSVLGPIITEPVHAPTVPSDAQDVLVSARVSPTFAALSSVVVRYRIMFGVENELSMTDDGLNGDVQAGDGIYSRLLPVAAASTNGQMVRWYFRATDGLGNVGRWPLFLNAVGQSSVEEEYLGTVVNPAYVTSQLPVFHLFIAPAEVPKVDTETGGRISVFHDGEFYDNIYMEVRGNTSAGLPKKAHRLEFNRNHEFRHPGPGGRVRKTSLLGEYRDSSRLRQHLSYWFMNQIGMPAPFHYPVRVQANGVFYQVSMHNDVLGQEQVERMGYDPKGAIYKAVGLADTVYTSTGGFVKLEPDNVTSRADYDQLAFGISDSRDFATRKATLFDMLDVPEVISYLIGARWSSENDDVWANMCLYRDTFGDQLWRCIPFDMDASWGCRWGGVATLEATVDTQKSHPLYGGRGIIPAEGGPGWNRIYDLIIAVPEAREMYLRRMRTVMDQVIQPPGTPVNQLIIENYIKSMTNLMAADMLLEAPPTWPNFSDWNPREPFVGALNNTIVNFVGPRRQHWYGTHSITNTARPTGTNAASKAGIPLAQSVLTTVAVSSIEASPGSGNQEQEYICITNLSLVAVDITDWKLDGGVEFKFKPGTVIPSNGVIYVSPNVVAFKQRAVSPRGGEGKFVVGPYKGQLSARGESLTIQDSIGRIVSSNSFIGTPSPAQQYLRITEIMYNPSPLAGNTNDAQQFEYLELKNISGSATLNLTNIRLTNGVDFNFTGSAVTSLAPGASVLVVRNLAAFIARYGALPNIAGQFTGSLDSSGEVLRLDDAGGEKVLEFDFNNSWYPITDGHGFSLVIVNENASWDTWGMKSSWRPSGVVSGSPGSTDPAPPVIAPIVINEVLTHTDLPLFDAVELWNPTASAVNIGGWFLSDDFITGMKYRFPDPTMIGAGGYLVVDESQFNTMPGVPPSFSFSSLGDEAYLFSANPATSNLTGYIQGYSFGASENGVSLGRHVNSVGDEHFVAQRTRSSGLTNFGPRVGPVVLSEIMYHPLDLPGGADNNADEFVELRSITNAPTPLFNTTNTWRLRGGISFDFPAGQTLAANTTLIVAAFNPTNVSELAAFRARFGVPVNVPVYGPFSGKLDNSTDSIRLLKPDAPDLTGVPYVLVDRVDYKDSTPWPVGADGSGASLQRRVAGDFGNDPANWVAATVTGGGIWSDGTLPTITANPSTTAAPYAGTAMFAVNATGPGPLGYQWRFNGNSIAGANSSILILSGITFFDVGQYDALVFNAAGSALSTPASLTLFIPAQISSQPQSVDVRVRPDPGTDVAPSTNASFTVAATTANPPLFYQWRMNGTNLLASPRYTGITSPTLLISNVVMNDFAQYACAVTDVSGTIVSSNATLYPLVRPTFLVPPVTPQLIPLGSGFTVSVALSNGWPPNFGYVWRRGSTPIEVLVTDSKTNFLYIPTNWMATTIVTNDAYRLIVTNRASPALVVNSQFFVTTLLDTDRDGIPDSVEIAAGLLPNNAADALLDLDGDKSSNLAEYLAGTDLADPSKYLKIESSILPNTATVYFTAVSNRTYSVQYTDVLPAVAWSRLADIIAMRTNRVEILTDPTWTSNRFYRAVSPREP